MDKSKRIFVAGHRGMIGSGIVRFLRRNGYKNIFVASRQQLDLTSHNVVDRFFRKIKPEIVFLAAAKVGGIQVNRQYPAEFLRENLAIQDNVISSCVAVGVKKLIFFACSCVYPTTCQQPMKEDDLLTGPFEKTNEGFAIAKVAGLKLTQYCHQEYGLQCLNVIPASIYGVNDNFDLEQSHVISALVKKFVDAVDNNSKTVILWGSGKAKREFMHVDDLVRAVFLLMEKWPSPEIINIGTGKETSIKNLALIVAKKVGYRGKILWDKTKPDGIPRKFLDSDKIKSLGFSAEISLETGLSQVIENYRLLR
ncbi:GDP-L-fucose synthase [Candidatus Gottesmanbacteria bacterium]|nr:GDP-L-fucose synthase [Candidatus Gottesmanbacteria bacterium]